MRPKGRLLVGWQYGRFCSLHRGGDAAVEAEGGGQIPARVYLPPSA
jgi:hypothetical protein